MRFLFVHQNFPGQYRHIAAHYARGGHQVVAIGEKANLARNTATAPGIGLLGYEMPPSTAGGFEAPVVRACARPASGPTSSLPISAGARRFS